MLGLDQRALKKVWTVFLFALAVVGVYVVRHTLVTFALALFLAHLISPIVTLLDRFTPAQVPRNAALGIVYVVLIGAFIAIMIPLGSAVAEDAASLAKSCRIFSRKIRSPCLCRAGRSPSGPVL
jgi:predicted PurR-regulated permease PerM